MREAQAALPEPTPVWLVLAIESTRYQMTAATTKGYVALWTADVKKKCHSQTAGELASTLNAYLSLDVDYPGREGQIEQVCEYLKRSTRLKFRKIDIERVCDFLGHIPDQKCKELLGKLVKTGLKQHPDSVQLNFQAGIVALAKSQPPFIGPDVIRHLEKALTLAEASKVPKETALLPPIKESLTLINEMRERVGSLPFGGLPFQFAGGAFDPFESTGF